MKLLIDADVLIGALDASDAHHRQARTMFTNWRENHAPVSISVVNLTEVLIAPSADPRTFAAARAAIATLSVAVHHPNQAIGVDAARLRQRHPISLPDAYCLATARHTGSAVASFDQKLVRAARHEQIKIA